MTLSVAIPVREQPAQRMRQEFEADRIRRRAMEQPASFLGRQMRDAFQIERERFLERTEDLLEGGALDCNVEIEADCLPVTIPAFGVAA